MQRLQEHLLSSSADPETASRYLDEFERRHPAAAKRLIASSSGLQALVAVFSNSRFLAEEILQHPEWIEDILATGELHRSLPAGEIIADSTELAVFRRRQLLRILIRDVLGLAAISEITEEISDLADVILNAAYRRIREDLVRRYGAPFEIDPDGAPRPSGMSVIALGKLGGRELNYSSDIDLMFVYSGNGRTNGEQSISNAEFFKKVANQLTESLSTHSSGALCYRIDLRLRPDGRLGEVCMSLDGARNYYGNRARDWELQMLIKARVAAGEREPGVRLLEYVDSRIYSSTLDFSAVEAVSLTRERIHEKASSQRSATGSGPDVKLTRGGIRDIEFLVQCLQRLHGGREPWVRHGGTMLALVRLNDKNLISTAEYSRLAGAYQFLRILEHRLQFREDRQTHTLPVDREQLEVLARQMPQSELGRGASANRLLHRLNVHLEEVQETYDRVIHAQQPLYYSSPVPIPAGPATPEPAFETPPSSNLVRFLDQRAPGIAAALQQRPLRHATQSFEAFLEKVLDQPDQLRLLNDAPELTRDVLEIFDSSPWYAEELVRRPSLLECIAQGRENLRPAYGDLAGLFPDPSHLRYFFRREMLRIQAASICGSASIFDTLGQTSELADAVIQTAYTLAVRQAREEPERKNHMMVIALGRLGMREFDLGSDADLNFVLPDRYAHEIGFWTRVAERMVDMISAYTGEGVMFAVDTRLRPNGREGALVQTASTCYDYIGNRAEAWEGITWMKSRCVAGDTAESDDFLHEVQQVDWRRYGQSGRSRSDLRNMRLRLEREQGPGNPLKAAPGGYYDIDFALMYLRLRSAGIFFRVLNTPERIDIIEKMGHLDRSDAMFLQEAATLYRAVDHGLRLYSGHAEGKLPQSRVPLDTLTGLVRRWTPQSLEGRSLPDALAQIQLRTRALFVRLFG